MFGIRSSLLIFLIFDLATFFCVFYSLQAQIIRSSVNADINSFTDFRLMFLRSSSYHSSDCETLSKAFSKIKNARYTCVYLVLVFSINCYIVKIRSWVLRPFLKPLWTSETGSSISRFSF